MELILPFSKYGSLNISAKYDKETIFRGKAIDLEEMSFNPLSVMVIDQNERHSYRDFDSPENKSPEIVLDNN